MSESNGYATREQAIVPDERKYKDIHIPGVGKVQIQTITELERSRMEAQNYTKKGTINVEKMADGKCRLIVVGTSQPKFTMNDVQYLRQRDSQTIDVWAEGIAEFCGISGKDFEELEKNSQAPEGSSQSS